MVGACVGSSVALARGATVADMPDVHDRVQAMRVVEDLIPGEPVHGSAFAEDSALNVIDTFTLARKHLRQGLANLLAAHSLLGTGASDALHTHLVALRPALLATSRGTWLVQQHRPEERVGRAAGIVKRDRHFGADALARVTTLGLPEIFAEIAKRYSQSEADLAAACTRAGIAIEQPPNEAKLVDVLANEINDYYGDSSTTGVSGDVRLLWHGASSLAHGEFWFQDLLRAGKPSSTGNAQITRAMTEHSLDAVCSGLNQLALRISMLALGPAVFRPQTPDTPER